MKINVRPTDIMVNKPHHNGNCHQFVDLDGSKLLIIFTKIRLGNAILRASGESNTSIFPGTILFLIIQKPTIPIPRSTATDSNVVIDTIDEYIEHIMYKKNEVAKFIQGDIKEISINDNQLKKEDFKNVNFTHNFKL